MEEEINMCEPACNDTCKCEELEKKELLPEFPESYTEEEIAEMIAKVNVDIVTDYFLIKPLKLNTHTITLSNGSTKETLFGYQRGIVIGKGFDGYANRPGVTASSKFDNISVGSVVYFQIYSDAFDSENSLCDALLLDAYRVKAVEKVK